MMKKCWVCHEMYDSDVRAYYMRDITDGSVKPIKCVSAGDDVPLNLCQKCVRMIGLYSYLDDCAHYYKSERRYEIIFKENEGE